MNPFETETMADLNLRQGHHLEALAIYRRLLLRSTDEAARERMARRIATIEQGPPEGTARPVTATAPAITEAPLPIPGVRARWSSDALTIEWRLPPRTPTPGLEVLLITRGPGGVETETRTIDLDGDAGEIKLIVKDLHLARVAAGSRAGGHFVPVTRS